MEHENCTHETECTGAKDSFMFSAPNGCSAAECPFNSIPPKIWEALLPKPFRKRHPVLFWGGIAAVLFFIWMGIFQSGSKNVFDGTACFAVVRVEGPILEQKGLLEWIRETERNDAVKGVLLRIDSPGGGVGASQEIYAALKRLNEKKPVVASMGSTAASGGLMAAMAARWIVANPLTVTGSIGVRMDRPQYYRLLEMVGLGQETLTTAPYKDAGSPLRPLNEKDRAYFQSVIDDMHSQFVDIVAEGRHMEREKAAALADGKICTGRAALALGLVDELGGQEEALQKLAKLTQMPEDTELLERPNPKQFLQELTENLLDAVFESRNSSPAFSYRF